ncbi:mannitol-1-phosphate dehydrogenase M1PDH1 [Cyathus striatus]|nr:mannitol-1-phosphate dehydrogenase M1PDH1 [Cyathus striatus]
MNTIPKTQKAAVLEAYGEQYILKSDYPVKQPSELAPNECLIHLEYSGVCHSDLHIKNNEWSRPPILPLVGGHEGVGRVVAIGDHSRNVGIKLGDRVGAKWIAAVCDNCEMCRKGNESACTVSFVKAHGFMIHGTFQQYVVSYIDYVTPIPESMDSASATPILCAGLTVYSALKRAKLSLGQWVAISGAGGGLGHLAIQYAVAQGARVLAIDTGAAKKELCLSLGAEAWVDFKESGDLTRDVQAATGGEGPHAALIVAGDPRPFNQALMYLRRTGTLVAVGMPGGTSSLDIPVTLLNLNIYGSAIGNRQEAIEALEIAARGKVKCRYEIRELEDVNRTFSDMEAGKIAGRVILRL